MNFSVGKDYPNRALHRTRVAYRAPVARAEDFVIPVGQGDEASALHYDHPVPFKVGERRAFFVGLAERPAIATLRWM